MGELAAAIAHEINQPLASILANARAAQHFLGGNPPDVNEVQEALRDIIDDDRRAGEVIRRLRSLLRREPAECKALDVNEMINEVILLIRNELVIRGLDLAFDPAADLPSVVGDRVQVQQVVLNLVRNALEAMADTPRQLRRVVIRTQRDGPNTTVSVSDAGPPISEAVFAALFEPFHTTKPDGLGMGLAISRSIIQAHGGRIWAERNADRGLTVHFTLPCSQPTASGCQLSHPD
jgi:two-component system sensor kinase FixL